MTESAKRKSDDVNMPANETPNETNRPSELGDGAIARRAYELYCARGCEDGHDVEDWLTAEREMRVDGSATTTA